MSSMKLLAVVLLVCMLVTGAVLTGAVPQAGAQEPAPSSRALLAFSQTDTVWDYHVVDNADNLEPHSEIGVDAQDRVHIIYCDRPTEKLKHVVHSGTTWYSPSVLPINDLRMDTWDAAIDPDGYVHVAYQSGTGSAFRYAYEDASGWHNEQVDGETSIDAVALALDDDGYPHVAYRKNDADAYLHYTHKDATGWWNPEVVDSSDAAGLYISLAVDGAGKGHISYTRMFDTKLLYAQRKTTGWYRWAVDADLGTSSSGYSSIGLTSGGYPHICYYGIVAGEFGDTPAFQYVYRDSSGWQVPLILDDTIASATDWECSLGIDGSDFVHMTYHRDGRLQHYYQDAQGWWTEVVAPYDGVYAAGEYNSIAMAYSGQPHISYWHEGEGGKLMYAGGEASLPALVGNTACEWGDNDCNRCANKVIETFGQLYPRGDLLGFHMGSYPEPDWVIHNHWQGVTRLSTGTGQHLIVTLDDMHDSKGQDAAGFTVVKMGSRNTKGERFRSNRLDPYEYVLTTAPPAQDVVVAQTIIPAEDEHDHPGSVQTMGQLMVVGVDEELHLYNLAVPGSPQHLGRIALDRTGKTGSSVTMAQLADGRYLLVVATSAAEKLDFYVSYLPNSYAGFWHVYEWDQSEIQTISGGSFAWEWNDFQGLSLVTDCATGTLYLIGTGNHGPDVYYWPEEKFELPWGPNWAGLYKIDYQPGTEKVRLTKVGERKLNCSLEPTIHYSRPPGVELEENCNFDAAAGAYVDADGTLLLYATEHDNTGVEGIVKAMEFRPQPHGTCTTIEDAWVEVFEHDTFRGRNMMIDYVDTAEFGGHHATVYEDHKRYNEHMDGGHGTIGLDEEVSSVKWCLPQGWAYRLYKESSGGISCKGDYLALYGAGRMLDIDNLEDWDFGDSASCSFYSKDPPIVIESYPGTSTRLIHKAYLHETSSVRVQAEGAEADMVTTLDLPVGAVGEAVTLTFTPATAIEPPDPPLTLAPRAFDLGVETSSGAQPGYAFVNPVQVTIDYHDQEVSGIDESTLDLYWWDGASWKKAFKTCIFGGTARHPDENRLSLSICKAGHFALMGTKVLPRVLYDEAHDSQKTMDWQRAQELSESVDWNPDPTWVYYGELMERLSDEFQVERNTNALLTTDLLAEYEALILDTPQQALTTAEVGAVQRYVAGGGGLIMLGECHYEPPNPELAASFGITFDPRCLFAPGAELDGGVVVTDIVGHAATGDSVEVAHSWGSSLTVEDNALSVVGTLGSGTWREENDNGFYDDGEEGVFDILAVMDVGCGRVAVLADGTFADSDLDWSENDVLMRAMLRWVSQSTACDAGARVYLPLVRR